MYYTETYFLAHRSSFKTYDELQRMSDDELRKLSHLHDIHVIIYKHVMIRDYLIRFPEIYIDIYELSNNLIQTFTINTNFIHKTSLMPHQKDTLKKFENALSCCTSIKNIEWQSGVSLSSILFQTITSGITNNSSLDRVSLSIRYIPSINNITSPYHEISNINDNIRCICDIIKHNNNIKYLKISNHNSVYHLTYDDRMRLMDTIYNNYTLIDIDINDELLSRFIHNRRLMMTSMTQRCTSYV